MCTGTQVNVSNQSGDSGSALRPCPRRRRRGARRRRGCRRARRPEETHGGGRNIRQIRAEDVHHTLQAGAAHRRHRARRHAVPYKTTSTSQLDYLLMVLQCAHTHSPQ